MVDEKVKKYFENPRKIEKVEADDNFNLHLTFDNGENRIDICKDALYMDSIPVEQ